METIIVQNEKKYWEFIRKLRNDERVKEFFIKQEPVTALEHHNFMINNWWRYSIALVNGVPAGFVRVMPDGDISVCVHPDFQKKNVGTALIQHIRKYYPSSHAKIKVFNEASVKLFEKNGFVKKYYILEQK